VQYRREWSTTQGTNLYPIKLGVQLLYVVPESQIIEPPTTIVGKVDNESNICSMFSYPSPLPAEISTGFVLIYP
jgi:hypothetical protein